MNLVSEVSHVRDYDLVSSGAGSSAVFNDDGNSVLLTAPTGSRSYIRINSDASPGTEVELTCLARRVSGVDTTSGGIVIDYEGSLVVNTEFTESYWRNYSCKFVIPPESSGERMHYLFGIITAPAGSVEIKDPRVLVNRTSDGVYRRDICSGVINLLSGALTVHPEYQRNGIKSLALSADGRTLTITTRASFHTNNRKPLIRTDLLSVGSAGLISKAGWFDNATSSFTVQFIDPSTAQAVDISGMDLRLSMSATI